MIIIILYTVTWFQATNTNKPCINKWLQITILCTKNFHSCMISIIYIRIIPMLCIVASSKYIYLIMIICLLTVA